MKDGKEAQLPAGEKISWISTRKASAAAGSIAGNLLNSFVLHEMVVNVRAPLHELSPAHLVMLEVPPLSAPRFEHDFLALVQKIRALGPEIAVIVQPSFRKQTNKALWVHKWNFLQHVPFRFSQTCSCQLGGGTPGCHFTCYVGNTQQWIPMACPHVPTPCATRDAVLLSLGAAIHTLCTILLRDSRSTRTHHLLSADSGSQNVPNSAKHSTNNPAAQAFPTDAKEREKARRKQEKEAGIEHVVKKKKKVMEDH